MCQRLLMAWRRGDCAVFVLRDDNGANRWRTKPQSEKRRKGNCDGCVICPPQFATAFGGPYDEMSGTADSSMRLRCVAVLCSDRASVGSVEQRQAAHVAERMCVWTCNGYCFGSLGKDAEMRRLFWQRVQIAEPLGDAIPARLFGE